MALPDRKRSLLASTPSTASPASRTSSSTTVGALHPKNRLHLIRPQNLVTGKPISEPLPHHFQVPAVLGNLADGKAPRRHLLPPDRSSVTPPAHRHHLVRRDALVPHEPVVPGHRSKTSPGSAPRAAGAFGVRLFHRFGPIGIMTPDWRQCRRAFSPDDPTAL